YIDDAAGFPAALDARIVPQRRRHRRSGRGPVDLSDADQGTAGGVVEKDAGVAVATGGPAGVAGGIAAVVLRTVGGLADEHLRLRVEVDVVRVDERVTLVALEQDRQRGACGRVADIEGTSPQPAERVGIGRGRGPAAGGDEVEDPRLVAVKGNILEAD